MKLNLDNEPGWKYHKGKIQNIFYFWNEKHNKKNGGYPVSTL